MDGGLCRISLVYGVLILTSSSKSRDVISLVTKARPHTFPSELKVFETRSKARD